MTRKSSDPYAHHYDRDDRRAGITEPVEVFTETSRAHPEIEIGDHEHIEFMAPIASSGAWRVSVYRGATPTEAMNAYADDLPAMVREGFRPVATAFTHNFIKYVGLTATGGSPQYVGQVTLMVTWQSN